MFAAPPRVRRRYETPWSAPGVAVTHEVPAGGFYPADLPKLEKDPFGWTPEELKDAVETARQWRSKGE